jgi:AcrR family transcriptional regulator
MRKNNLNLNITALLEEYDRYEHPSSEKQRQILEAAEKLFSELGYDNTATAQIARAAGVTERTLFNHFPTKECLWRRILSAVIIRIFMPHQLAKVKQMVSKPWSSFEIFFKSVAHERLDNAKENSDQLRMIVFELLHNENFRLKFTKLWRKQVWDEVVITLNRLQAEGKIKADVDVQRLARSSILMTSGYIFLTHILAAEERWDHDAEMEAMLGFLTQGVVPTK